MMVDQNRIYLEDIGEIVMSRGGKDIWLVKEISQHEAFRGWRVSAAYATNRVSNSSRFTTGPLSKSPKKE